MAKEKRTALSPLTAVGVVLLVAVVFVQMLLLARVNSATWDESDHTYSAYMQAKYGDYGLNPEHPPLVKYLAALPLLGMHLREPALDPGRSYRMQEVIGGREFLFGNDANAVLFRARMGASVLTLLLAVLVFLTGREMFSSDVAGLVALGLVAFDPTLLGNSALVTTDAGQACFMLATIYALYRYTEVPTRWRLLVTALAMGLALASKHSAVLLFPMIAILMLAQVWSKRRQEDRRRTEALRLSGAFATIVVVSLIVLWAFYGFRFAARESGHFLNPTLLAELLQVPSRPEAEALRIAAKLRLLPESYVFGFAHVLAQAKIFPSFLLRHIYPHAVWFYFPPTMLIKSTLTFLVLAGVSLWAFATGRAPGGKALLYLLVPAIVYLLLAMAGGSNIGVRYVLPVYIFAAVAIGGAAAALMRKDRRWVFAVVLLLFFQAVSVLRSFPAYIAYANEAAGGPPNVHRLLSDSSADWGQQLKSVKAYLDAHGIQHCWFAYFGDGVAEPSYYGIPCKPLITADSLYFGEAHDVPPVIDGPVLISAGVLSGFEFGPAPLNPYEQFESLKPAAVIDYGVFVFPGHYEIPLAAALSHVQKAGLLLAARKVPEALAEARQAETLAPESARVNAMLAQVLEASGQHDEARASAQTALRLAETVQPAFQQSLATQMTALAK